jgi:hypothetical protein
VSTRRRTINRNILIPKILYSEAFCEPNRKTTVKPQVAIFSRICSESIKEVIKTAIPTIKSLKARHKT